MSEWLRAVLVLGVALAPIAALAQLPGVGESVITDEIRVTLVGAERLTGTELDTPNGRAAGGLRIVWLVENRPGVPIPPTLGEVRVFLGSRLYNPVTNATSRKPFAPDIIILEAARFFDSEIGRRFHAPALQPRPGSLRVVLEARVRGQSLPEGVSLVGEIEQGSTEGAQLRDGGAVSLPPGFQHKYYWFRFRLPPI